MNGDVVGTVGLIVPGEVLLLDGETEGDSVGLLDGKAEEIFEGNADGALLGLFGGELVGLVEGGFIGAVGLGVPGELTPLDGNAEGWADGLAVGGE